MDERKESPIRVVGVGGAGCNAVDRMIQAGIEGVGFIACNTDAQALSLSEAPQKILLGPQVARGSGTGGNPALGNRAAQESRKELEKALAGSEILFIACGLGGGTGTGGGPVVAEVARSLGATVLAVVTKPFAFEGTRRRQVAAEGLLALQEAAHCTLVIPNDRLVEVIEPDTPLDVAFRIADDVLRQGVQGIAEIVTRPGLINLDLGHIKSLLSRSGKLFMAMGQGEGEEKATDAVQAALSHPLTDGTSILGAQEVLVHISGGPEMALAEVRAAVEAVAQAAGPGAEITMGTGVDPRMAGKIQVTIIAVGMEEIPEFMSKFAAIQEPALWESPSPLGEFPFAAESDLDIPSFIRRRRALSE